MTARCASVDRAKTRIIILTKFSIDRDESTSTSRTLNIRTLSPFSLQINVNDKYDVYYHTIAFLLRSLPEMTDANRVRPTKRRRVSERTSPKADDSNALKKPRTRQKRASLPSHEIRDTNIDEGAVQENNTQTKDEQSPKPKRTRRTKDVQGVNGVNDEVAKPQNNTGKLARAKPRSTAKTTQKAESGKPETPPRRSNRAKKTDDGTPTAGEKKIPEKSSLKRSRSLKKSQSTKLTQNKDHTGANDPVWEVPIKESEDQSGGVNGTHAANTAASQLQLELSDQFKSTDKIVSLPYIKKFASLCEDNRLEGVIQPLCNAILERLNGKRPIPLKGLETEYDTVHQLIEQTVVAGEGNSLLLLGARGCGKTAIVDSAISSITKEHKDDFYVVRLNGFLHTDDKIALREIWRQLGRENCPEEEEELNKATSYADTLASLLALLSHPEEFAGPSQDVNSITTTKSVIIVIDEFDLFSYHPRQTLLYNLFDIAQARKAPVAVLGLTTKVDVTENLEKRVKSRFSHRYVFLPRPRTFADFSNICMASLEVSDAELSGYHGQDVRGGDIRNLSRANEEQQLCSGWNSYLEVWQKI